MTEPWGTPDAMWPHSNSSSSFSSVTILGATMEIELSGTTPIQYPKHYMCPVSEAQWYNRLYRTLSVRLEIQFL